MVHPMVYQEQTWSKLRMYQSSSRLIMLAQPIPCPLFNRGCNYHNADRPSKRVLNVYDHHVQPAFTDIIPINLAAAQQQRLYREIRRPSPPTPEKVS